MNNVRARGAGGGAGGYGCCHLAALVLAAGLARTALAAAAPGPVIVDTFETAGIDGRAWDKPFPHARTADAVHRAVLIRFPGAAQRIAQRLEAGAKIAAAEVVFEYGGHEIAPAGYEARLTHQEAWKKNPPRWHYVAWALRRPWSAAGGAPPPTFNAFLNGAGYWTKYGAGDEQADRYPACFGPAEVSQEKPEGRMDITALLTEPAYGADAGERLRRFEEQGLLVRKWETYDVRYADWSAYEWAVATGGHGLTFKTARLEVRFEPAGAQTVRLPPARDLAALAQQLARDGSGGRPTAVMPDAAAIREYAEKLAFRRPGWMPQWQWERVQELRKLGGGTEYADAIESGDAALYERQIRTLLARLPRYWLGWSVQDLLLLWHQYREALPPYVQDHLRAYWAAWLYPDLPNSAIDIDPQGDRKLAWYRETGDWRGRFSFFRVRWTQGVGTMNFNHTACMGALLGGAMIGSEHAMTDGRQGLEKMLLRFWTFQDGTSQEMLDHYYFSITLSGQKMFADYAPTHLDRLMGQMIRDRAVELLISGYHPRLRRALGSSWRTRMSNVLGFEQEGGYSVLHTLSPAGVLFHADRNRDDRQRGMHLFGYDFPPGRVALQTRAAPWAPEWAGHMVDDKPLPYEVTAADTTRGNFRNPPLWQRTYLGRYYGLASQDIKGGTVDVLGQWTSTDGTATDAEQLGTLTVRYNINRPRLAQTEGGVMPHAGGIVTFQHRNRAIVCAKPRTEKERTLAIAGADGVRALYATVALWMFRDRPSWQLYVDGTEQKAFPAELKAGQRITLRDGNAYAAIIPLPATDLGRDAEVVIEPGIPEPLGDRHRDTKIAPALMINSYNLRRPEPLAAEGDHWQRITREAYNGFIIEMGDSSEHASFEAFQKHIASAKLDLRREADKRTLHIAYRSGADTMEMGFCTDYAQSEVHFAVEPGQHRKAIPYRRVNGQDPYLPDGIDRDTTLTQQGRTGRLAKNGAVLEMDPGRTGYLQTEPVSGTYTGYNPLPDLSRWSLAVPGGVTVRADGKLGLARIAVRPAAARLWVDYAYKPEQMKEPDIARRLLVGGMKTAPTVELNGRPMPQPPQLVEHEGVKAWAVPLE